MVDGEPEPDAEEMGLAERHVIRALHALVGLQDACFNQLPVDPDQVMERLIRCVVRAHDGRTVTAIAVDHDDLIGRPRIRVRGHRQDHEADHG